MSRPSKPNGEPRLPPDIEIAAGARARTVRFEDEPDTRVDFHGDYVAETVHERENLPDQIEPEVTYRDVRVRWHTSVRIDED